MKTLLGLIIMLVIATAQGGQDSKGGLLVEMEQNGKIVFVPLEEALSYDSGVFYGIDNLPTGEPNSKLQPSFNKPYVKYLKEWLAFLRTLSPNYADLLESRGEKLQFIYINRNIVETPSQLPDAIVDYKKYRKAAISVAPAKGKPARVVVSIPTMEKAGTLGENRLSSKENQGFILIHELINATRLYDVDATTDFGLTLIEAKIHDLSPEEFINRLILVGVPVLSERSLPYMERLSLMERVAHSSRFPEHVAFKYQISITGVAYEQTYAISRHKFADLVNQIQKLKNNLSKMPFEWENLYTFTKNHMAVWDDYLLYDCDETGTTCSALVDQLITVNTIKNWLKEKPISMKQRKYLMNMWNVDKDKLGTGNVKNFLETLTQALGDLEIPTFQYEDLLKPNAVEKFNNFVSFSKAHDMYLDTPNCLQYAYWLNLLAHLKSQRIPENNLNFYLESQNITARGVFEYNRQDYSFDMVFQQKFIDVLVQSCHLDKNVIYNLSSNNYDNLWPLVADHNDVERTLRAQVESARYQLEVDLEAKFPKLKLNSSLTSYANAPFELTRVVDWGKWEARRTLGNTSIESIYLYSVDESHQPIMFKVKIKMNNYRLLFVDPVTLKVLKKGLEKQITDPEPLLKNIFVFTKK